MNPEAAQKPCGALHDSAVIEEQHILGDAGGKLYMVVMGRTLSV